MFTKKEKKQIVVYHGPEDDKFVEQSFTARLQKEKRHFVRWVQRNFKSKPMQRHAIEQGAFHFANQRYDALVYLYRQRIEQLYDFKMRLLQKHRQHLSNMALEHQQLQISLAEMEAKRIKIGIDTRKLLTPPDLEGKRIEHLHRQDELELRRLKQEQMKRRAMQHAVISDAKDRATARAEYKKWLRAEFQDDELVEEALDEFDRAIWDQQDPK